MEKNIDGNHTRMLRAIFNQSSRQHHRKQQLCGLLPHITKTIQVRRTSHARHCWRSRDEIISDLLLWIPSHGRVKVGRPAKTYIPQLCTDTGRSLEDLPEAMNDKERWWGEGQVYPSWWRDMMMKFSYRIQQKLFSQI